MTGPGRAVVERLDVSDLSSVEAFADRIGDVDVLVNNAGILGVPQGTSVDGVELHLATNHLGHHALALRMLPRIGDRVVVVSSNSHHHGDLDVSDLDWARRGYQPYSAYAASKLANMLFLLELQRRLTEHGSSLRVTGAHPGTTATAITSSSGRGWFSWIGSWGHHLVGMPVWRGALPTLYAATMDVPGNSYVGPDGFKEYFGWPTLVGRSASASDPGLARACWGASVRLSGVDLSLR
jgi:NAD(P)-dependent dehydrogenase (short-subunit alcohol dehydrogenase family)